jgi:hypothetical protein
MGSSGALRPSVHLYSQPFDGSPSRSYDPEGHPLPEVAFEVAHATAHNAANAAAQPRE